MFYVFVRGRRPLACGLLVAAVFATGSSAWAACDVTGKDLDFAYFACGSEGVNIRLEGEQGTVTLSDFLLQPTGAEGYVQIFASDTELDPTDIVVELSGETSIYALNYDGLDIRTVRGDILVTIGEDSLVDADQTGIYVLSEDISEEDPYVGGDIVINNYGIILAGPQNDPMGATGISGVSDAGGVAINNYGTVVSRLETMGLFDGFGIYADGGDDSAERVEVSIYNAGSVDALHDGLRVTSYNGLGKAVNDVGGEVVSRDRRGVVVWSQAGAAEFENYGAIVALDGSGAAIWAEGATDGYAKVINGGTILAFDDPDQNATDSYFPGLHIWSEVSGDAILENLASGGIVATDGVGVFMQSTDGSVIIDNAGLIMGEQTAIRVTADDLNEYAGLIGPDQIADYLGASGGDIALTNSGIITSFDTAGSGANEALISLAGASLGETSVTNLAGGFIGAGLFEGTDLSLSSLASGDADDLDALLETAGNKAISLAVQGTGSTITNQGTLVGRVLTASPFDVYGAGAPTSYVGGSIDNQGLWVVSGETGYLTSMSGSISNTGTIFSLGETYVGGTVENSGAIWVNPTDTRAANLYFLGDYSGETGSSLVFNLKSGAVLDGNPLVTFADQLSGQTDVVLADLGDWDWTDGEALDLIDVAYATPELGADSFVLAEPVRGLVRYSLNYDDYGLLWSLGGELEEASVEETTLVSSAVTSALTDLTSDLLTRTDDLRDMAFSPIDTAPLGYAETPLTPADEAFAALTPAGQPVLRAWTKADGQLGGGEGFDGGKASISLGADITADVDGTTLAGGVFGTLSGAGFDYAESGSSANISAQAIGAYGMVLLDSGLFTSGVLAVQTADVDLLISGESAAFRALSATGRIDLGYRTMLGGLSVEPSLGYVLGSTGYDDFELSGTTVSIGDADSRAVEGRLRVSSSFATETADISPFAVLTLGQSLGSAGTLSISGVGDIDATDAGGLYGGGALGLQATSLDGKLSGFVRADLNLSEASHWTSLKVGGSSRF